MATDGRPKAIIETSVLVNFLKIDRTDLLSRHPAYRFVVLDLVRNEVGTKPWYAAQADRLTAAIAAGHLLVDDPPEATPLAELAAFAAMSEVKIGEGERAAVAAAYARGLSLAMQDHRAWKRTATYSARIPREDTVSIVASLIKAGILTVAEADAIKADWEANHKFTLTFASFAERI
jgi:predicted nucleic acid-binding protein